MNDDDFDYENVDPETLRMWKAELLKEYWREMEQFNVKDTYLICLPIADSLDFSLYFCYHNIVNYENMRGERHDHHGCKIEPCVWV